MKTLNEAALELLSAGTHYCGPFTAVLNGSDPVEITGNIVNYWLCQTAHIRP